MATTAEELATQEIRDSELTVPTALRGSRGKPQIPRGEAYAWLFMRVSGLFLIFLALGHFLIMHMINDVRETNFDFVVQRWGNPFWRVWDWLLLALGLFHGTIGVRTVLEDNISKPRARSIAKVVLYSVAVAMFVVGTVILITFGSTIPRS